MTHQYQAILLCTNHSLFQIISVKCQIFQSVTSMDDGETIGAYVRRGDGMQNHFVAAVMDNGIARGIARDAGDEARRRDIRRVRDMDGERVERGIEAINVDITRG